MPSIPLKAPAGLALYNSPANAAHLTIFYNTQSRANEHLLVVFGATVTGGIGELAHLRLTEEVFNALATAYPVATKVGLTRSDDISVEHAQQLLAEHWPPAAEETQDPD